MPMLSRLAQLLPVAAAPPIMRQQWVLRCGVATRPRDASYRLPPLALWLKTLSMVERDNLIARCHQCVLDLDQRSAWGLSVEQIANYAEQLVRQVPAASLERQMAQIVGYFHSEHSRVAALRDPSSASHADAWVWVAQEIARVTQLKQLGWSRDPIVELHDLVQVVQAEVVRSLPTYQYESRLSTWLHAVTIRRLRRFHRDNAAAKRAVQSEPLDAAADRAVDWSHHEQRLLASSLWAEITRVLAQSGDERYARIFFMRVVVDLSNEEIAAHVQLHPSRVRALLRLARELLRSDPRLRSWSSDSQSDESETP